MSRTYDMLADSLNELITDFEVNDGKNLSRTVLTVDIAPARKFSSDDIRSIRQKNHLTQSILAKYLCVSKKTIEAWESGRNTPNGPSSRLLELLDRECIINCVSTQTSHIENTNGSLKTVYLKR